MSLSKNELHNKRTFKYRKQNQIYRDYNYEVGENDEKYGSVVKLKEERELK